MRLIILLIALHILPPLHGQNTEIKKPNVVFLISKDSNNYEADKTIPLFAREQEKKMGWTTKVLQAEGPRTAASFKGLGDALKKADVLVVFARRLALPEQQMNQIKEYLRQGKPIIGIRTANHAFTLMDGDAKPAGFHDWPEFVPEILGCLNTGYGPVEPGTDVKVVARAKKNPLLTGIPNRWHSTGNLYLVDFTIDPASVPLLKGSSDGQTHPIAWTRTAGKSKVFYTSLGHPADFDTQEFKTLVINAVGWAIK